MPKKSANAKPPANEIWITRPDEGSTDQESCAWALVNTPFLAAITANSYLQEPVKGCMTELAAELQRQVIAVNYGEMRNVEGLLVAQAHTLNAIFTRLAQRAINTESRPSFEANLKLALRAQNQCRATLETLSTIKNPPNVAFIRQANVANNQQVNNGPQAGPSLASQSPTRDSTPPLEHTDGNYLDTGTATTASGNDPAMATVGEIHRPKDRRGKG